SYFRSNASHFVLLPVSFTLIANPERGKDLMPKKIKVAILDDHQSIIDGYLYRLKESPKIEVTGTLSFGSELEPWLAEHPADVMVLDVNVPAAPDNPNPYPILHVIP